MSRKLALKCLKHSDLTLFKRYYDANRHTSKQKAINLDAAILVREFYPSLLNAEDPLPVMLNIQGPGITANHQLFRYIRKQSKNWRLEGALVDDPTEPETERYGKLQPGDLAVLEFIDGPNGLPNQVTLILLSAVHKDDEHGYAALKGLLAGRSMATLLADTIEDKVYTRLNRSHPLQVLLSAGKLSAEEEPESQSSTGDRPSLHSSEHSFPEQLVLKKEEQRHTVEQVKSGTFAGAAYESVPPKAAAFIETLRAIGYSPETAIADLVDNSIAASASVISINFRWAGSDSKVLLTDDGRGMSEPMLVNAMRPGSTNPLEERSSSDLGRFGMGLKTASFSQCRRLTVLSKAAGGTVHYRCWDLDHIAETEDWHLLTWLSDPTFADSLGNQRQGTVVIWELADRLVGGMTTDKDKDLNKFNDMIERVQWHLEMIFHRYLQKGLVIKINGTCLKPWDPFLAGRKGTQRLPDEEPADQVSVTPYILPHHRMFDTDDEYYHAGRVKGWNGHQGFYIYRNDRLLVAGDWLGLFARDEHHRLARIAISLSANLDQEWQIDIRKARAWPPHFMRERLRAIAGVTRKRAADVYRSRGHRLQTLTGGDMSPVWIPEIKDGRTRYKLNREHPAIETVLDELDNSQLKAKLRDALRLIEEAVPVSHIALTVSEANGAEDYPFDDDDSEALEIMFRIYRRKRTNGATPGEARHYVSCIDPFHRKPHLLEQLID